MVRDSFKIGDIVKRRSSGIVGKIINYKGDSLPYLVQFDDPISNGHDGNNNGNVTGKSGHCWWHSEDGLELIAHTDLQEQYNKAEAELKRLGDLIEAKEDEEPEPLDYTMSDYADVEHDKGDGYLYWNKGKDNEFQVEIYSDELRFNTTEGIKCVGFISGDLRVILHGEISYNVDDMLTVDDIKRAIQLKKEGRLNK